MMDYHTDELRSRGFPNPCGYEYCRILKQILALKVQPNSAQRQRLGLNIALYILRPTGAI